MKVSYVGIGMHSGVTNVFMARWISASLALVDACLILFDIALLWHLTE